MGNKKKIVLLTLLSALTFCGIIVASSLSPLSEIGNANQFNSIGMWLAIFMILVLYALPLMLYSLGLEWVKYVMSVFCALGILSIVFMILIVLIIGATKGIIASLTGVIFACGINLIINFIWFVAAFSKTNRTDHNFSH